MQIRKATFNDSEGIVDLILLATKDVVYSYLEDNNYNNARAFMQYWAQRKNNLYSYQNCWLVEKNGKITAVANIYNGARFKELRRPILQYLKEKHNRILNPEDETKAGEYYLDTLAVDTKMQDKGTGTRMLNFLINEYVIKQQQALGLLVDIKNPKAKQLYLKLGFKPDGKKTLLGIPMEHMQIKAASC